MSKGTGKSINTPMRGSTINTPHPEGEMGTGLDFAKEPHEGISGHNLYPLGDARGEFTGQSKSSKIVSPAKVATRVKIDE